ncbi:hypothetical protein THAOC_14241, partial [Thalassiosira oceanica]
GAYLGDPAPPRSYGSPHAAAPRGYVPHLARAKLVNFDRPKQVGIVAPVHAPGIAEEPAVWRVRRCPGRELAQRSYRPGSNLGRGIDLRNQVVPQRRAAGTHSPGGSVGRDREDVRTPMSCTLVATDDETVCANCGLVSSDTVKLKSCTACRLVKYCGVDCQRAHRKQHKKACKQRAAELKDEELYSQGHEKPEGDFCPICALPIPLPMGEHSGFNACCMKRICDGCDLAAQKRGMFDCPFCRTPLPENAGDMISMIQARVLKKDPEAIYYLGLKYFFGELGLQRDIQRAVELWAEAAELGSIQALYNLGLAYDLGDGVQQDMMKAFQFYRRAAMQGHALSRNNLGCIELKKENYDRAVRHFLISAKMGHEDSVEAIKDMLMEGLATKEHYTQALKGYQDAMEEMKSHDRDEAKRLGY